MQGRGSGFIHHGAFVLTLRTHGTSLVGPSGSTRKLDPVDAVPNARLIAFYLPQFHPTPLNDESWGKGFTEWTNVTRAKPLFPGHHQPDLPSDLGFYDLRLAEVRQAQADLAREYGIEGFCYWHYWFGNGRRMLERVFNDVLESGRPDFPFCLGWANQTWSGAWAGLPEKTLVEQTYPGEEDQRAHFQFLLRAFKDRRYIRANGKPLFVVYRPKALPNSKSVITLWKDLAVTNGLPGLCVAGITSEELPLDTYGYDMLIPCEPTRFAALLTPSEALAAKSLVPRITGKLSRMVGLNSRSPGPRIMSYRDKAEVFLKLPKPGAHWFECVMPNWDNTPRASHRGWVFPDACPALYRVVLRKAIADLSDRTWQQRIVFLKSWNEWAEGNYLEPSVRFGHGYLKVTQDEVTRAL